MAVTREGAEEVLRRVNEVLALPELPCLKHAGICYLFYGSEIYDVTACVFGGEIPYHSDPDCPPEWQCGVWSEERMTLLCMLGALSADDIVEMCQ